MKIFKIDWSGNYYVKAKDGIDAYRIFLKYLNRKSTKECNPETLYYHSKPIEIDVIEEG